MSALNNNKLSQVGNFAKLLQHKYYKNNKAHQRYIKIKNKPVHKYSQIRQSCNKK